MKREYKLSSIVIIQFISIIVAFITSNLFTYISKDSEIIGIISGFVISIITFFFQFSIASGLIRNRMGSVGEYLNQVNLINGRIILINFLLSLLVSLATGLMGLVSGGIFLSSMMVDFNSKIIGSFLILGVFIIISMIFAILISYCNYYCADKLVGPGKKEGLFESIKNIFSLGSKLFGKTILVYLKYVIGPVLILGTLMTLALIFNKDTGLGGILLISLIVMLMAIYSIFASAIVMARLSDNYLDYVEAKENL